MANKYDVIVAGAGPAGSIAAAELAGRGYRVLLLDRKRFPRHKPCASWVNRLAFDRFEYLRPHIDALSETPFSGITFRTADVRGAAEVPDRRISGYLTLRHKFDDALRRVAQQRGAEFRDGAGVEQLEQGKEEVTVTAAGERLTARVLVAADGANSRIAVLAGMRRGWTANDYVLCANEDIPADPARIASFYPAALPLLVAPRFAGVEGYGWIFPKRAHICAGIGGRIPPDCDIRELFRHFLRSAKTAGILPPEVEPDRPDFAIDPAGAVTRGGRLVSGRVVLVGDAGGFVSGSTGEGIYPGMVSAACAAGMIHRALAHASVESVLAGFQDEWKRELGSYVRPLPGGGQKNQTHSRLDLIFRSRWVARIAARAFLYGEPISFRTAVRALR